MSGIHRRGFASMDPEKRRAISSVGGRTAHALGKAHKFTPEEASEAGKIGGRSVSRDRGHMSMIGSKGGSVKGKGRSADQPNGLVVDARTIAIGMGYDRPDDSYTPCFQIGGGANLEGASSPVEARPMRLLMENGPFGGCTLQAEEAPRVPGSIWIDRRGMVMSAMTDFGDLPHWLGRVVDPVPVLDMSGDLNRFGTFGYELTIEREEGFDAIFRFSDSTTRGPRA